MPVVQQEGSPVFLRSDGIGIGGVQDRKTSGPDLHPAGCAGLGKRRPDDLDRTLQRTVLGLFEGIGRNRRLRNNYLGKAGAIPEAEKEQLATRTPASQPAADGCRHSLRGGVLRKRPAQGCDRREATILPGTR